MPRRSLRTVLTVWNAAALAVLFGVFGVAIVFANQNRVHGAIDDALRNEAERASRVRPPRGNPNGIFPAAGGRFPAGNGGPNGRSPGFGGGNGQPGMNPGLANGIPQGPGPGNPDGPQGAFPPPPDGPGGDGQAPPPGQNGGAGQPPAPNVYEEAARLSDIRRPRFFGPKGGENPNDPVPPFETTSLTAALHGQTAYGDAEYQGDPIRVVAMPMVREGQVVGAVQVAQEVKSLKVLWQTQLGTLALFLPLAILAAAGGAYALTGRTLQPIRRLTRAASEISHSDLSKRLEVAGDDEIAEMAATFNRMLARLEASFTEIEGAYAKLARAYDQQQRFTADAAHELRTPLTRLRLATSAALEEAKSPEEMRRALATADRAATSMTRLVQDLLTLAKADTGQLPLRLETADLRVIVAEALENLTTERIVDTAFSDRPLMINADTEHLQRVVTNLVENACRHTPESGSVRVEVVRASAHAVISIRDTGEGIAPEHLPRIFDRFYRADAARTRRDGGSGLGLSICKNLVEAHRGQIEIESSPGVGTTVRVAFPIISAPALAQTKTS